MSINAYRLYTQRDFINKPTTLKTYHSDQFTKYKYIIIIVIIAEHKYKLQKKNRLRPLSMFIRIEGPYRERLTTLKTLSD